MNNAFDMQGDVFIVGATATPTVKYTNRRGTIGIELTKTVLRSRHSLGGQGCPPLFASGPQRRASFTKDWRRAGTVAHHANKRGVGPEAPRHQVKGRLAPIWRAAVLPYRLGTAK